MEMKAYITEACGQRVFFESSDANPPAMLGKLQQIADDANVRNGHIEAAELCFDHPNHFWDIAAYECDVEDGKVVIDSVKPMDR